jgi:hypothetical protein
LESQIAGWPRIKLPIKLPAPLTPVGAGFRNVRH